MNNPILETRKLGQSFWFDTLGRRLITSGELRRMIERDGLRGVTSNPTIFEKAMVGTEDYDSDLQRLVASGIRDPKALYEGLAIADIQAAADLFRPGYDESGGADGFVSLEVSPHLAHSTEDTVVEARRLFQAVARENVMIKVPGTAEGMPAIERLIAEGINVNVTLLFGLDAYRACADAHIRGLERRVAGGGDVGRVAGVASFFLSRIDVSVDKRLDALLGGNPGAQQRSVIERLRGKIAIANAKRAYAHYQEITASDRWRQLADRGARPQRVLWASTGTTNPAYSPTMYVDPLIGPETVNTVTAETYRAFLEGGRPRLTLSEGVTEAAEVIAGLSEVGISLDEVTDELLEKGIDSFLASFGKLLAALEEKQGQLLSTGAAGAHQGV